MRFCLPCDRLVRRKKCERCGADTEPLTREALKELMAQGYQPPPRQSRKALDEYEAEVEHAYAAHTDVRP